MSKSVYVRVFHDLELLRYVLRCEIERQLDCPARMKNAYCYCCYCYCYSTLLSRLTALARDSTRVTSFLLRIFEYPPKWCTYSAGMAGTT